MTRSKKNITLVLTIGSIFLQMAFSTSWAELVKQDPLAKIPQANPVVWKEPAFNPDETGKVTQPQPPRQPDFDPNGDRATDTFDLAIVAANFGETATQKDFDPRADVNADGIVNVFDLVLLGQQVGPRYEFQMTPSEGIGMEGGSRITPDGREFNEVILHLQEGYDYTDLVEFLNQSWFRYTWSKNPDTHVLEVLPNGEEKLVETLPGRGYRVEVEFDNRIELEIFVALMKFSPDERKLITSHMPMKQLKQRITEEPSVLLKFAPEDPAFKDLDALFNTVAGGFYLFVLPALKNLDLEKMQFLLKDVDLFQWSYNALKARDSKVESDGAEALYFTYYLVPGLAKSEMKNGKLILPGGAGLWQEILQDEFLWPNVNSENFLGFLTKSKNAMMIFHAVSDLPTKDIQILRETIGFSHSGIDLMGKGEVDWWSLSSFIRNWKGNPQVLQEALPKIYNKVHRFLIAWSFFNNLPIKSQETLVAFFDHLSQLADSKKVLKIATLAEMKAGNWTSAVTTILPPEKEWLDQVRAFDSLLDLLTTISVWIPEGKLDPLLLSLFSKKDTHGYEQWIQEEFVPLLRQQLRERVILPNENQEKWRQTWDHWTETASWQGILLLASFGELDRLKIQEKYERASQILQRQKIDVDNVSEYVLAVSFVKRLVFFDPSLIPYIPSDFVKSHMVDAAETRNTLIALQNPWENGFFVGYGNEQYFGRRNPFTAMTQLAGNSEVSHANHEANWRLQQMPKFILYEPGMREGREPLEGRKIDWELLKKFDFVGIKHNGMGIRESPPNINYEFYDRIGVIMMDRQNLPYGRQAHEYVYHTYQFGKEIVTSGVNFLNGLVGIVGQERLEKIAGMYQARDIQGILDELTPSEVYYLGRMYKDTGISGVSSIHQASLKQIQQEFLDQGGQALVEFKQAIDNYFGIMPLSSNRLQSRHSDILLKPYESYKEDHQLGERLSVDFIIQLAVASYDAGVSFDQIPFENAFMFIALTDNPSGPEDWQATVNTIQQIDPAKIRWWMD